jgi:hypothetical protein
MHLQFVAHVAHKRWACFEGGTGFGPRVGLVLV